MFQLNESDQKLLLQIARSSVRSYLANEPVGLPEIQSGALTEQRGIFVSIHQGDELRGCIGSIHTAAPLYRSASECAISAAVGDPRFVPLLSTDLSRVEFEISVLSPVERIRKLVYIEIGKHGLMVTKKAARGVLLPQIATAFGWDQETFLQEACKKAGLQPEEWKDGAIVHRFSALVFGERHLQLSATS
jgi:AmmeMemoRadiSam system protein A